MQTQIACGIVDYGWVKLSSFQIVNVDKLKRKIKQVCKHLFLLYAFSNQSYNNTYSTFFPSMNHDFIYQIFFLFFAIFSVT